MSAKTKLAANILKALGKKTSKKKKELEAKTLKELKKEAGLVQGHASDRKTNFKDARKKNVTKTLEKEKKRQLNVNKNQKSGGGVNKIVRGDESKDALKTAPKTQKELKAEGAVSGPSSLAFMAAIKGKAKGLAEQVKKKKKLYDALSTSDKRGEKGQLLQNAIKDMQKKLKGQVPIRTLRDANLLNKGGMAKKKKTGNMDYRKGGLVIMIGMGKPKKGTK